MIIMKDNYLIQVPDIHIGNEILSYLKNKGISIATLARTIRMDPANLSRLLKRKSMETLMLIKISQAIGHNFFLLWIEDTTLEQFSSTIAEENAGPSVGVKPVTALNASPIIMKNINEIGTDESPSTTGSIACPFEIL